MIWYFLGGCAVGIVIMLALLVIAACMRSAQISRAEEPPPHREDVY